MSLKQYYEDQARYWLREARNHALSGYHICSQLYERYHQEAKAQAAACE